MSDQPTFKTRARVINQLGEQLIKNESIALLELIKNSYDAYASVCLVHMHNPDVPETGEIVIQDDGIGMTFITLSTAWLEIGTSYKTDPQKDEIKKKEDRFKRLPLGEKGIGRLGVHRLGREIEIVTHVRGENTESTLVVNWDEIEKKRFIEDLPVKVEARALRVFKKAESGTKIVIKRLRKAWSRGLARDCARAITSLNSPFESDDSFRVDFDISSDCDESGRSPESWLEGITSFRDIEQYKLFAFDITMAGTEIIKFQYEFLPWETMKKLRGRKIGKDDQEVKTLLRMQYKEGRDEKDIDLSKYEIGNVRFKGIIFDRDARVLNLAVSDKRGLKGYLSKNGGVRVFRDNMRVLDYGEQGNDWLDLSGRRVNMPTKRVSNNIILGAVYLERDKSRGLKEKANREGFVENEAYLEFVKAIRFAMGRVESLRHDDKNLLRKYYGATQASEPVTTSIGEVKDLVDEKVKDEKLKKTITRYLDRIDHEYEEMTSALIKSAGAGLNLTVVIHQIEKIIKEIMEMMRAKAFDAVDERVETLSRLVEGYTLLVKKSEKKERNLKGIVEQCCFNIEFRLQKHCVQLIPEFREKVKGTDAICSKDHVLNALMNLFDNSIWWLRYGRIQDPKVFFGYIR